MAVEQHPYRGAHRNPPGRAGALGDRAQRRHGRSDRPDPAGAAGRGGRRDREASADPDFLLEPEHLLAWEERNGRVPDGSWLLLRTGWSARAQDEGLFLNADENGPHTPGPSAAAARWLAEECSITGFGVETVGIDAGQCRRHGSAVSRAPFPARRGHLRPDPTAEPRPPPGHRGGADRHPVADRRRHRAARPASSRSSST